MSPLARPTPPRLPASAAWRHVGADGFEVAFLQEGDDGLRVRGSTSAVEDGSPWVVAYALVVDADGHLRQARVRGGAAQAERELVVEADGRGGWLVDGTPRPELDGCLDLDLESSALTNAFPVRRLGLIPGATAQAPAAYVRAADLRVERLEQTYHCLEAGARYDYAAPAFAFSCELVYASDGLVQHYPGIAERVH